MSNQSNCIRTQTDPDTVALHIMNNGSKRFTEYS